ncbi:unnamed protein product [Lathyrus oleraceus]
MSQLQKLLVLVKDHGMTTDSSGQVVDIYVIGASLHPVVHTQVIITSPVTTVITISSTTSEVDQLTIAVADLPVRKLSPTPSPGSSKRACLSKIVSQSLLLLSGSLSFFPLGYLTPKRNVLLMWPLRTYLLLGTCMRPIDEVFLRTLLAPYSGSDL